MTLPEAIYNIEAEMIERAIGATENRTQAAKMLGVTRQYLMALLTKKHKALADRLGIVIVPKRHSILTGRARPRSFSGMRKGPPWRQATR